jgi:hypothetical protein
MEEIGVSDGEKAVGSDCLSRVKDSDALKRPGLKGGIFMKYGKATMAAVGVAWAWAVIAGISLAHGIPAGELLRATPDHYDFGVIAEGEPAVATAGIENIGNVPVEITNVRTS